MTEQPQAASVAAPDNPPSRERSASLAALLTASAVDAEHRAWVQALPVLRLTPRQFLDLREYSCTNPTGTTPGKTWRRFDGSYDLLFKRQGGKPRWLILRYDPDCPSDARTIRILRFRPIISLRAASGPRLGAAR